MRWLPSPLLSPDLSDSLHGQVFSRRAQSAAFTTSGSSGVTVLDESVSLGTFTALNFVGAGVVATNAGGGQANITIAGGGGGSVNTGTATLNFGAFPGASDASVAVTGQAGIVAGSKVQAWMFPATTADHTADEHILETIRILAGNIVPGVGFTIYGVNSSEVNEPVPLLGLLGRFSGTGQNPGRGQARQGEEGQAGGGKGTRIYGQWNIGWMWI